MKIRLLLLTLLLMISGCSKSVEKSTLINKDGLMYLPDSDTPYTGEVFFNNDTGEKEYQGTYENGLLIEYSYLNKDGTVKEPINIETLVERDEVFYTKNTNKPYTGSIFSLFDDGINESEGSLKNGKLDGEWIEWYNNGQMLIKENYLNGIKDGSYSSWNDNGQKLVQGIFRNGDQDGLWTYWYENGQKEKEMTFSKGKMNGLWTWFYKNGSIKGKGTYKNGQKNGKWSFWNDNEIKDEEYNYIDGVFDGLWTTWYYDGNKRLEGIYIDGLKDGLWTWWYENGQKEREDTFNDKIFISEKCWDKNGIEIECKEDW